MTALRDSSRPRIAAIRTVLSWCLLSLVPAVMAAAPASAQRMPQLIGSTIRIQVDSNPRVTGIVVAQTPDTLILRAGDGRAYSAALAHVQHAERYAPRRHGWLALAGFMAGGALGAGAGVYAANRGIAKCQAGPGDHGMCGLEYLTVPVYALGGVVVGTTVGGLWKLPHWEPLF